MRTERVLELRHEEDSHRLDDVLQDQHAEEEEVALHHLRAKGGVSERQRQRQRSSGGARATSLTISSETNLTARKMATRKPEPHSGKV
jgi:hypothetical protein